MLMLYWARLDFSILSDNYYSRVCIFKPQGNAEKDYYYFFKRKKLNGFNYLIHNVILVKISKLFHFECCFTMSI